MWETIIICITIVVVALIAEHCYSKSIVYKTELIRRKYPHVPYTQKNIWKGKK